MERAEVQALIKEELERSSASTRIRQLQGATKTGLITLTWPGAAVQSNAPTTPHGLGKVPADIQLTARGGLSAGAFVIALAVVVVAGTDATNLQVTAKTHDGSLPVAGTTATIHWAVRG